jgi:hypothetical protein
MSSPFTLFRKHQKIMLVVLIGLSMLSFVIFGTVSQAADLKSMPPMLIAIAMAALVATVAWVVGIPNGKSGEYGSMGLILGAALGAVIWMRSGTTDVVTTRDFGISGNEMTRLLNQRYTANRFIGLAIDRTAELDNDMFTNLMFQQHAFRFDPRVENDSRDVVLGELLRREGRRLGMSLPESAVNDFINSVTNRKMTPKIFQEIRSEMHESESDIYDALRNELTARMVQRSLYGGVGFAPGVDWEMTQRLQVQQKLEVAEIPIAPFIDDKTEPPEGELETLFAANRENFPGFSPRGQMEEGRPGFLQPRRINVGYLQPDYLAFEKQATVTDAQIEARYLRDYGTVTDPLEGLLDDLQLEDGPLLTPGLEGTPGDGPFIPSDPAAPLTPEGTAPETGTTTPEGTVPEAGATETPETPAQETPETTTPSGDAPATPEATGDQPASESTPTTESDSPGCDDPAATSDTPLEATTDPVSETPADPATTPEATETPATDPAADPTTDPAATPAATTEADAATTPTADAATTPAPDATATDPAATDPAADPAASTDPFPNIPGLVGQPGIGEAAPPIPTLEIPPLDDALRATIRDELLKEETARLIEVAMAEALTVIGDEISRDVNAPPDAENKITLEAGTEKVKAYAAEHHLLYEETGLLSKQELLESEDHPIGTYSRRDPQNPTGGSDVADDLFSTSGQSLLNPRRVEDTGFDGEVRAWAIYWKLEQKETYVPDDMSDERIRAQVVRAWRELKAREVAEQRATVLAEEMRKSDKTMVEAFAGQTVTGEPSGPPLNIQSTQQFSWMRRQFVPTNNPFNQMGFDEVPQLTRLIGLEPVGEEFMETVFDELEPGQVGVAPSLAHSHYYVAKVIERFPSKPEDWEIVRTNFLSGRYDRLQMELERELFASNVPPWPDRLLETHEVQFREQEQ